MILGICGMIAVGKSFLAQKIARNKIPIIELDAISREVFADPKISRFIFRIFQTLDRQKIARLVFEKNPKKLIILEKIMHPKMRTLFFQKIHKQKKVIVVSALPKSFSFDDICDRVIVVAVCPKIAFLRARKRGISRRAFQNICRRQKEENQFFEQKNGLSHFLKI